MCGSSLTLMVFESRVIRRKHGSVFLFSRLILPHLTVIVNGAETESIENKAVVLFVDDIMSDTLFIQHLINIIHET